MPTYHDLRGKRVFVTGASSGIGKACARAFLKQGSLVALHHHSGSVRDLLSDFPGDVALALQGDLASEDACTSAIGTAVEAFGGLDTLVCSAGIVRPAPIASITAKDLDEMFRLNLFSLFYLIRDSLPHLSEGSSIILF